MNTAGDLHQDMRSVTRTTTRNALGDCGPVVSLNRRDGSNPLRRRRFKPVTVCRATSPNSTPVGVLVLTLHAPEGEGVSSACLSCFPRVFNDIRRQALAGKSCARAGVSREPRAYTPVEESSYRALEVTARGVALRVDSARIKRLSVRPTPLLGSPAVHSAGSSIPPHTAKFGAVTTWYGHRKRRSGGVRLVKQRVAKSIRVAA